MAPRARSPFLRCLLLSATLHFSAFGWSGWVAAAGTGGNGRGGQEGSGSAADDLEPTFRVSLARSAGLVQQSDDVVLGTVVEEPELQRGSILEGREVLEEFEGEVAGRDVVEERLSIAERELPIEETRGEPSAAREPEPRASEDPSLPHTPDRIALARANGADASSSLAASAGAEKAVALNGSASGERPIESSAGESSAGESSARAASSGTGDAAGSGLYGAPEILSAPPPAYPLASQRLGEEGTVLLRLRVRPDGRVRDVAVVETSRHERLDRAALEAVRAWLFRRAPSESEAGSEDRTILHRVTFRLAARR